MKKLLPIILLVFVGLFSENLVAQESWTLEKCLRYARENNLELKQARINTKLTELDLQQSRFNRYPNLNGNVSQRINFGRFVNPTTNAFVETTSTPTTSLGLSSSVDLFTGFRNIRSIEKSELQVENAEVQYRISQNNLDLQIVSAYLEILKSEEQISVLKEQSLITQKQKERTEKLINAGVLPQGDILNLQAQIANEELTLVNAENMVEMAKLNLAQTLQYYDKPINIVKPDIEPPSESDLATLSVNKIYTQALKKLPEMQSVELQKKIAEKDVEIANSGKYPTLSLSGGASTNFAGVEGPLNYGFEVVPIGFTSAFDTVYNVAPVVTESGVRPLGTQFNSNFTYYAGLNLSVPIFNRYQVKNNITRSKISQENTLLQSELTKRNLLQTIQQAYQSAVAAAKTYEVNQRNIESLQLSFNNIEKKYELGLANALELSTAQNQLAVAKLNLNSAKYEYLFRLKILEFYQGKPLNLK